MGRRVCLARLGQAGLGLVSGWARGVIGAEVNRLQSAEDLNPPGGGDGRGAGASRLDDLARRQETAADPAAGGRGHGEHP